MTICRLCLQEKELCKKSHIIPNFMYKELFDSNHRMVKGTPITGERPQNMQSGEYEGGILCADCDNRIIGGYEGYASQVLYGGKISVVSENVKKVDDGLEITIVHGLDYRLFKLFLLSLLWRASISSLPFFQAVKLGPYEEKLRLALINGDPGGVNFFPCILTSYRHSGLPVGMIAAPRKSRLDDGKIIYAFVVSGMMYVFRVVENEQLDWILGTAVNEMGDMQVPHTNKESAARLFNKLLGEDVF